MNLQIRPLSYSLGSEIIGVDLSSSLDDASFNQIYAAFLEHYLLLFRGQRLTREQHIAFSRRFGEVYINDEAYGAVQAKRITGEHPEIILRKPVPGKPYKPNWHSDLSSMLKPAQASLLRAVEVPEVGGDTMFANMYLAYDTLSEGMKKLIDGLYGVHIGGDRSRIDNSTPERAAETRRLNTVAHPIVRVHPETGRKALCISEKVKFLAGMTREESAPLIKFLIEHATRPQLVYRHQWTNDDLLVWDNRCTLHNALDDYDHTKVRHLERTTVRGTPSGHLYTQATQ